MNRVELLSDGGRGNVPAFVLLGLSSVSFLMTRALVPLEGGGARGGSSPRTLNEPSGSLHFLNVAWSPSLIEIGSVGP